MGLIGLQVGVEAGEVIALSYNKGQKFPFL